MRGLNQPFPLWLRSSPVVRNLLIAEKETAGSLILRSSFEDVGVAGRRAAAASSR